MLSINGGILSTKTSTVLPNISFGTLITTVGAGAKKVPNSFQYTTIVAEIWAGGGAGGGVGISGTSNTSGGGSGGYSLAVIPVTAGSTLAYNIGAGGLPNTSTGIGATGGSSTLNLTPTNLVVNAGTGGGAGVSPGVGGAASTTGDINIAGNTATAITSGTSNYGPGADAPNGGTGGTGGFPGVSGGTPGAGGGGGYYSFYAGGNGGGGALRFTSPSSMVNNELVTDTTQIARRVPVGVTSINIEIWGAGGMGQSGSYGASSGAYCKRVSKTVTPGQIILFTIGKGGDGYYSGNYTGGSSICDGMTAGGGTSTGSALPTIATASGGDVNTNGTRTAGSTGGTAPNGGVGGIADGRPGKSPGGGGGAVTAGADRGSAVGGSGAIRFTWSAPADMINKTIVTGSGTGSKTVPAGVYSIDIETWGAGGSGGCGSGSNVFSGAGSGAYSKRIAKSVTPGDIVFYTLGAGGISQTTIVTAGNDGGATTCDGMTAGGGVGGGDGNTAGVGGTASGGDVNTNGNDGIAFNPSSSITKGGSAPNGGIGGQTFNSVGTAPGGGGAGGTGPSGKGGDGGIKFSWTAPDMVNGEQITATGYSMRQVPAGVTSINIEIWGAGGSGDFDFTEGDGGGGGAYCKRTSKAVTPGDIIVFSIGVGGASVGATGSTRFYLDGNDGGDTTSDSMTARGGKGAPYGGTAAAGGTASGGNTNTNGGAGVLGTSTYNPGTGWTTTAGNGGASPNGGAGGIGTTGNTNGGTPGGGGAGGNFSGTVNAGSGTGGPGGIKFTW